MEWQIVVAIALAIPIIGLPAFLVWAAVTSGLYQVARDGLRRRARISRRTAKAKGLVRTV